MSRVTFAIALAICPFSVLTVRAEPSTVNLTLDGALARLRGGPSAQLRQARLGEARGQLAGAGRLLDNPTISGGLGPRLDPSGRRRSLDGRLDLLLPLGLPGRGSAQLAAARATVETAVAEGEGDLRAAEAELATAFFRALASQRREEVVTAAELATQRSTEALQRRHELRDIALLDLNLGKAALARTHGLLRAARADRLASENELRHLLALDEGTALRLQGDLGEQRRFTLSALLERAKDRPDVRALLAEARQAEAELAVGRASRWPRLAVGGSYERDQGDDVLAAVLSVELPLFDRAQAVRTTAEGRARRLRLEAELTRRAALTRLRGAFAVQQERQAAAAAVAEALPLVEENEALARKSYQAGQLPLADWMVVRREDLETRLEHIDQLLAAALAGVSLALTAGVSP